MQTLKRSPWQDVRVNLLRSFLGLLPLSLLVAWCVEQVAETLFMNW